MRHIETYKGSLVKIWETGLKKENAKGQRKHLNNLRKKYVVTILLSEANIHREKVQENVTTRDFSIRKSQNQ
jgi:hypothetical protein